MLAKFKVKGYKGFQEEITFDFKKHNDYQFNNNLIKNDIVNKAIIYGKNGAGKTSIGFALFDIIFHLTDKNKIMADTVKSYYLNLDTKQKYAEFSYEFIFDKDQIIYNYKKESLFKVIYEEIIYNGQLIFKSDSTKNIFVNEIDEAKTLNFNFSDQPISWVKYICNNTIFTKHVALAKMMDFVNGMLWFRSVDNNSFIGFKSNPEALNKIIIDNDKLEDFSKFLVSNGLYYNLKEVKLPDAKFLAVKFASGEALFDAITSTGTNALWLYYCWELEFSKVTFLFIDEFDATYHFEVAANIIKRLNSQAKFQSVVTTHNTYLMSNKLTRPDCTYIITPNFIKNLSSCTDKELREAHNIEKLYREGEFTD